MWAHLYKTFLNSISLHYKNTVVKIAAQIFHLFLAIYLKTNLLSLNCNILMELHLIAT